jgi:hypothetical protein
MNDIEGGVSDRLENAMIAEATDRTVGAFMTNLGFKPVNRPMTRGEYDAANPLNLNIVGFCAVATVFAIILHASSYHKGQYLLILVSSVAVVGFPVVAFMAFRSSMIVSEYMDK